MFGSRRVLLILPLALAFGCEKKPSAQPAAPPPGMPPLEAQAAPPGDHPEHPSTNTADPPAMPPGHPALPAGHPAANADVDPQATTPGNIAFDPKSVISGVLRLDDKVKAKVKGGDTIFLVARGADPAGGPGPILAVKKLTAEKWPMPFQLDGRDAMMTGTSLSGKVVVSVRVDKDGDAMTKNPGDVTGVSRSLAVPADKVVITLDTVL